MLGFTFRAMDFRNAFGPSLNSRFSIMLLSFNKLKQVMVSCFREFLSELPLFYAKC